MSKASGLLRAAHFKDTDVRLTKAGLVFKMVVTEGEEIWAPFVERFGERDTLVIMNPPSPTPAELSRIVNAAKISDDRAQADHGLEPVCPWKVSVDDDDDQVIETAQVLLVAFKNGQPVGYARRDFTVSHFPGEKTIVLRFDLKMTYVLPAQRGKGFGIDLSIATALVCHCMLHAVYRAAPSGTTIMPVVASEFESVGGEKMVVSVFESLKTAFETLKEEARDDVTLENVEMDAGY